MDFPSVKTIPLAKSASVNGLTEIEMRNGVAGELACANDSAVTDTSNIEREADNAIRRIA